MVNKEGLRRRPKDLTEIADEVEMSNLDHSIDPGLEEALRERAVWARHSAWNFNGQVWFEDGTFFEEVWHYHVHIDTVGASSLEELMRAVNDLHGWD